MLKEPRILVVDDEKDIRELVVFHIERAGYTALQAGDGEAALSTLWDEAVDLVILDLMLPGQNGLEVLKTLRADPRTARLPVILLTAKTTEVDRIVGFEMGTDDYVTKPFSVKELIARVKALLRRSRGPEAGESYRSNGFTINFVSHLITLDGAPVEFSPREFALFELLYRNLGAVVGRGQILEQVWGLDAEVDERVVDVNITRLREKMGAAKAKLKTVKGYGYRLDPGGDGER
ncbi:MAG: response regulator transcription factor [Fibrobacterota bacterium]